MSHNLTVFINETALLFYLTGPAIALIQAGASNTAGGNTYKVFKPSL